MRIRRRGRHTAPSQVEKVAEKAGKAAPAMAIAGALVAAPQAQHALTNPVTAATAQAHKPLAHHQTATATLESVTAHGSLIGIASTRHAAAKSAARRMYKVRSGDTLSGIAGRYYHNADDWPWLYHENNKKVRNPDLIYTGQTLLVTALPAHFSPDAYIPRHAKPAVRSSASAESRTVTRDSDDRSGSGAQARSGGGAHRGSDRGGHGGLSGQLGCSGLEDLWDSAGGNPADAFIAAEIAMAESGGNQYALSPTQDYGYWQINISNGALATFDAYGNARSAIILSDNGANWDAWTTYTSGAYAGRC